MAVEAASNTPMCAVVGPLLYLTVTVESEGDASKVHLHPGGQGFWVARMLTTLGCGARLVAPVGGEAGPVLTSLMESWEVELEAVAVGSDSPVQVHDRRSGERVEIVALDHPTLDRHDADELYGACLQSAMIADAVVLTAGSPNVLADDAYRRLVHDIGVAGKRIYADLHGGALDAALDGGALAALKVSEDDLAADGWDMGSEDQAVVAARRLRARGAELVVISRAGEPAIAAVDERMVRVVPPTLSAIEHRGAGDSMTGAIAAGRLLGLESVDAIRLGAAAGAGNVTRRGLGSGRPELIVELTRLVDIEEL